ncbi:FtsX-like permease family protein [Thalassomonas viridans]|uniref:FtsX-like permease family protein n=1 Tax=Thalassomonas viridans TaxID=137584 RepID=A0AAE9Z7Z0_9GAMM|nr:FtsX-like permease family protein [Thalassomonas viridans]WDE07730.1 FtsX-like permease family protein [Thalassomonas viridans]
MNIFKAVWFRQSKRLLLHELRRGDLTIICLAIVLAVATVYSLSGFSGQIQQALLNKSTSFIASDRVLQTSREVDPAIISKSEQLGLDNAKQVLMSSMVFAGDKMQLAQLKAVTDAYPLRGELLVSFPQHNQVNQRRNAPEPGKVWVEKKLLTALDLAMGDKLEIGVGSFVLDGIIEQIPDASFSVFTNGPAIILNESDMGKTQLIQPASRLTYKYLFAGEKEAVDAFEAWIKPQVNETQRWYDIQSRQSPLANALNRAEKYLSLASMLGIILAAVAVAVASRRYSHRHQPMVAVFKAMGASMAHIQKLYCLHWGLLSLFGILLGLMLGYALLQGGLYAVSDFLPVTDFTFSWYPLVIACVTGLICAIAFAVTPLKHLVATPALSVIRGFGQQDCSADNGKALSFGQKVRQGGQYLLPLAALFALLVMFSKDLLLSFALLIGGILVSGILVLFGRGLMSAGRVAGTQAGKSWHLAMANLKRRAKENSVQLVSFTIAIKLLLLIVVIRSALLSEWQQQLPQDAPNRFLINVSQVEVAEVDDFVAKHGLKTSGLYPVVRGRLTAINEEKVAQKVTKEEDKASDNGRRGVGRELNLTWREQLPKENKLLDGSWWGGEGANGSQQPQVSVELGVAERLQVKVGDTLTFQLGSESFTVPVTSIREVNWQSMQPNFFMIFSPGVLADFPATYISSLYVPDEKDDALQDFMAQHPTISMIDVDAMIGQLHSVIAQVSLAVEFILVLVVIAGSLVLVAQVQASMEEREREVAILRTLGAKGALLRNSVLFEFVALGAIAGLMASVAMEIAVYFLQTRVFEMSASLHFQYWGLGIVSGGVFVGLVGMLSCWRLLNMSSVTLIRRTM